MISAATSRARQREMVIEWQQLTPGTQRQKMEEIFAEQQQELERQQLTPASQTTATAASAEPAHIICATIA